MVTYPRWQKPFIKEALLSRRVLILEGARQCGKTTLVKDLGHPNCIYRTLDDTILLNAAKEDPKGFVQHGDELMIIDEIQKAPLLLPVIKKDVDENQNPGRFILTGSAHIQSLPAVTESLAGRVRKIRLRPLSMGEIYQNQPNFLEKAFQEQFDSHIKKSSFKCDSYDKNTYLGLAFKGGYPEALRLEKDRDRKQWHQDYVDALMERDLKDITHIKRKDSMKNLIKVLAAWSSKFMDISAICTHLSISRNTIESYMNALETLYMIERFKPWHKTDYDRIGKQEKIFMTDTGLMTSLLNWRLEDVRLNGDLNGKLIETFVFNQLSSILEAQEEKFTLYHYKDREKREIDFIVEGENGDLLCIEVKSGTVITKDMFKHIIWFRRHIAPCEKNIGIILYAGEHLVSFGESLWAIPIHHLF